MTDEARTTCGARGKKLLVVNSSAPFPACFCFFCFLLHGGGARTCEMEPRRTDEERAEEPWSDRARRKKMDSALKQFVESWPTNSQVEGARKECECVGACVCDCACS